MDILEASHLKKSYLAKGRLISAVRDVSLRIAAGEVVAFLGPNGAGKTTTVKMIAGLVYPDHGWVRIVDRDPHRHTDTFRVLGAVLEGNRNVYWRLTPAENLEYFGVLRGLSPRVARQRGQALLKRFRLIDRCDVLTQALSRGMQQKLAIAVALIHQPPLLLLDEPTLGLDVEATEEVKNLVQEIAQEGRAILLTTHQLAIAEELSHRVAIINHGEIVAEETADTLIRQFSSSIYIIKTEQEIDPERQQKLQALGLDVQLGHTVSVTTPDLLYPVFDILRPLLPLRVERDDANLTDVFLKLVRNVKNPHR
jgi:ABC-2 type transport system ATP-binding protein